MPPNRIRDRVQTRQGKRNKFELGDGQPLLPARNALNDEPRSLEDSDDLRERVPLRAILNVMCGMSISGCASK